MNRPKRHHWWPLVQSRHWLDLNGKVCVTKPDGTSFRVNPRNIGVESELYTRFREDDSKDIEIEEWLAQIIEPNAKKVFSHILNSKNINRSPYIGDPKKAKLVIESGFKLNPYIDYIKLPDRIRKAIASYTAALLVRNPTYLKKLQDFHSDSSDTDKAKKTLALDNMLYVFEIYEAKIAEAEILFSRSIGKLEYLYADGGLQVNEPWKKQMPFDIHVPLTPKLALQVFPMPISTDLSRAGILEATDIGVNRQNKIMLAGAQRFVFSRRKPNKEFIISNFGRPVPKNIAYRFKDGKMELKIVPEKNA